MKQTIALISLLLLSTACVVTPPTNFPVDNVEVHGSIEPRVHFGSRSQVSIWLHPEYALPDAYTIAQNHCRGFGLWADPFTDWAYNSPTPRILNYNCIGRRPRVLYPHIRRQPRISRPHIVRPPRRGTIAPTRPRKPWYRRDPIVRRPRVITPEVRHPRRPSIGRDREVGKPWEYNRRKNPIVTPRPTRPRTEVGKPWEHKEKPNFTRNRGSNRSTERRTTFNRTRKTERPATKSTRSSKSRRSTLSL